MTATFTTFDQSITSPSSDSPGALRPEPLAVTKRDGRLVPFDKDRITAAIAKAYIAELGIEPSGPLPGDISARIRGISSLVVGRCSELPSLDVERIQDEVERELMLAGEHAVARRYVLYRERRALAREASTLTYRTADGTEAPLDTALLATRIRAAATALDPEVDPERVLQETLTTLYRGIPEEQILDAAVYVCRSLVEWEPGYSKLAARLLLTKLMLPLIGVGYGDPGWEEKYRGYLRRYIAEAIAGELLDPRMGALDLDQLAAALSPERDAQFELLGMQTLADRYLLRLDGRVIELPQLFWMRVAMGISLGEADPTGRALEFYDVISSFLYTPATPTLFNSGTTHPQLSSCYLTTVQDDLREIFKAIQDNALLSKWAGGLGNDWTSIRALGAKIRGTGGTSQGVIPFLKIVNDAAVAVNQGGKRKGAVCAYLECWHLDFEEFLELRRNTGDERRRTHDLNTAAWIPDLFMKRVEADAEWHLFCPSDVGELHDLYGAEFEARYLDYEAAAAGGLLPLHRKVSARELWRKMLSMLFETGHPWITFKDPSNLRSTQRHAGVVHNSNLCTEILLNNSKEETAVCNLGSVNLVGHLRDGSLDGALLQRTVRTAIRMLDNVIDLNFYPTPEARQANMRHRPIGLGIMGFQDMLYAMGIPYGSEAAAELADRSMELISFFAIEASCELAGARGSYASFSGSSWSKGEMPIDTIRYLAETRRRGEGEGEELCYVPGDDRLPWQSLRDRVRVSGIRNSNLLAIAPTATISNIVGVSQSIEPSYKNLFVKSNLSGDFTQVNEYLVRDLKARGLWSRELLDELKYYDGALGEIAEVPPELKSLYQTAFEIDPAWIIECAARRQRWLDMGQSLNLYLAEPDGRKLHEMYLRAWKKGLKTTYYLRSLAATQIEKSSLDLGKFKTQPRWMKAASASRTVGACELDPGGSGECDACQ